jgi:formylglycine-generating enzyme required for sulfatase activity
MRSTPCFALLLAWLAAGPALAADARPVVAVFNVEGKRIKLDRALADALADHAAALLTETGRFQVVPRGQIRERLTSQKTASYKDCYEQSCQIEVGKELAAEKSLSIQVLRIGSACTVNVTLYDLKRAATEAATTEKARGTGAQVCGEDALLAALEGAVRKLAGAPAPRPEPKPPEPVPAPEVPTPPVPPPPVPEVEMVDVPGGFSWRGCNKGVDPGCSKDEQPGRLLELSAFSMDKTEVSVAQYKSCVEAGRCSLPDPAAAQSASSYGWGYAYGFGGGGSVGFNFQQPGRENYPMNGVTWRQAREYCAWAGKRLPTEAEWERAARGPKGGLYPWGMEAPTCERAVMSDEASGSGCGQGGTAEVCSRPEGLSGFGLCDMAGNVWEWVEDLYAEDYFARSPDRDPQGPKSGGQRVLKGGAYKYGPKEMRISHRSQYGEESAADDVGFRCARSP